MCRRWAKRIAAAARGHHWRMYRVPAEDFEQAGYCGLLEAIRSFQKGCGCRFRTYANGYIHWRMLDEARVCSWYPKTSYKGCTMAMDYNFDACEGPCCVESAVEYAQESEWLQEAMKALPPCYQRAVRAKLQDKALPGVKPDSVSQMFCMARQQLKGQLK